MWHNASRLGLFARHVSEFLASARALRPAVPGGAARRRPRFLGRTRPGAALFPIEGDQGT